MNPSTIYHRPRSEFAFALDDTHYVFRLRTGRGEVRVLRRVGQQAARGHVRVADGPNAVGTEGARQAVKVKVQLI